MQSIGATGLLWKVMMAFGAAVGAAVSEVLTGYLILAHDTEPLQWAWFFGSENKGGPKASV